MTNGRALIVDDSKTAQARLKKMLRRHDLEADVAFSAEEALGCLSYRVPSIIFMDHHMEGMDGFEALRIIKANPNTAMIPVIMYTAQKGDVYIGQARALGAIDILSKETFKPSSLEAVLKSLNMLPSDDDADEVGSTAQQGSEKSAEKSTEISSENSNRDAAASSEDTVDLQEPDKRFAEGGEDDVDTRDRDRFDPHSSEDLNLIRAQVARLFELHIADVRSQISQNSKFVVGKLKEEIDRASEKDLTVGDVPLSVVNAEASAERSRFALVSNSILILILVGLATIGFEMLTVKQKLSEIREGYAGMVESSRAGNSLLSRLAESRAEEVAQIEGLDQQLLLEAVSWAMGEDLAFDYGETPLSEARIGVLSTLVYKLYEARYTGSIILNINFGNMCLKNAANGGWEVAPADLPLTECVMLQESGVEFSPGDYLSVSYMAFEQTALPIKNGDIELQVVSSGLSSPRYDYPSPTVDMTASEWNKIAEKNNRITIGFADFDLITSYINDL